MLGYLVRVFYDYSSPTRASLGLGTYALRPQRDIAHGERASCKTLARATQRRRRRRSASPELSERPPRQGVELRQAVRTHARALTQSDSSAKGRYAQSQGQLII